MSISEYAARSGRIADRTNKNSPQSCRCLGRARPGLISTRGKVEDSFCHQQSQADMRLRRDTDDVALFQPSISNLTCQDQQIRLCENSSEQQRSSVRLRTPRAAFTGRASATDEHATGVQSRRSLESAETVINDRSAPSDREAALNVSKRLDSEQGVRGGTCPCTDTTYVPISARWAHVDRGHRKESSCRTTS